MIANSINSIKTLSGKEVTDVNGQRYKKFTQIEVTSSRGTLLNDEILSEYTMNNGRKNKGIVHTKS